MWSEFYLWLSERFYRRLLFMLGNSADAEDALHETLKLFFEKIDSFDDQQPLEPWLWTIARNVALNQIRSRKQRGEVELVDNLEYEFKPADAPLQPEEHAYLSQALSHIKRLAQLTDWQMAVLVALVVWKLKPDDIAALTDLTPKQVRQFIWRLRKKLRNHLSVDDFTE